MSPYLSVALVAVFVGVLVLLVLAKRIDAKTPSPKGPHGWQRTDQGGELARRVECNCGFVCSGYSWKEIDDQMATHDAVVATENLKSKE